MDDQRLERLKKRFAEQGWQWRDGKPIPYGAQLVVSDGTSEATLDFYPKRGRTVVGGSDSPLRRALQELAAAEQPAASDASSGPTSVGVAPLLPLSAELGMDESGKGDWFGPLVVAAVYLEPASAAELRRAGVRDSKLLDGAALTAAAAAIERVVPETARQLGVLLPEQYNRRYAEHQNINVLLAELYAETATPVVARVGAKTIVCDQFAQRADRLDRTFAAAGLPRPRQMHHAEAASLAVAAASVLATARFQAEMAQLGQLAGLNKPLPRGASAIGDLTRAVRRIVAREGPLGLGRYAKLHFKPVQELLATLGA